MSHPRRAFIQVALLSMLWGIPGCRRTTQQLAADRLKALGCDIRFRPVGQSLDVFWIEAPQRPLVPEFAQSLDKMPTLETLILAKTSCTADELSQLPLLPRLKMLDLSDNDLSDSNCAPLSRFTSLETLILDGNPLTDAAHDNLSQLRNLQALSLRRTKLTSDGFQKLQTALPACLIMTDGQ